MSSRLSISSLPSALLTGCTSRRMAAALAAPWGVQRVILTRSWPISRVRNLKIFRVDQQSLSSLRCAIDCSSLRKMSAALGASWGVQRVDLADLVAKSPDLVEVESSRSARWSGVSNYCGVNSLIANPLRSVGCRFGAQASRNRWCEFAILGQRILKINFVHSSESSKNLTTTQSATLDTMGRVSER